MKKYPKVVQCDSRGQIVIPKDVRRNLEIGEGSAFYMYTVTDEGILLKKLPEGYLQEDDKSLEQLKEKSDKVGIDKSKLEQTQKDYQKQNSDNLEEL